MLVRLSANDSPPTLSTGTHATRFPQREVVAISVSGVYRHSVLKFKKGQKIKEMVSLHIYCAFQFLVRQGGTREVSIFPKQVGSLFVCSYTVPKLGQNAEKRFIPNTTIHRWFTFMGEKKVLLLLEILQNWVDILERLVDFCSHLHNGEITCMCDMKEQKRKVTATDSLPNEIVTLAPVSTTLPDTKMSSTIRGFTILQGIEFRDTPIGSLTSIKFLNYLQIIVFAIRYLQIRPGKSSGSQLENCECVSTKPSSRIGNLTSQEPT